MILSDLFQRYGVQIAPTQHRHVRAGWVGVDCPSCSPNTGKFKLGFHPDTGRANCWTCGRADAVVMISQLCRISLREAIDFWKGQTRFSFPTAPHTGRLVLPKADDLLPVHRGYLERRGFDPDEISKLWGIKGIGQASKLQWRILIPIHDPYGKIVSWTTRSISKLNPLRYVSASPDEEAIPHKNLLYGAHLARHTIIINEGPIDAWAIGPGAVATLGVGYSQIQMALMCMYPIRVVCFDSEDAAQKRAEDLCMDLSAFPGRTENLVLETGKDSAEADPEEILEIRRKFL